jgi:hypothetical protein
MISIQNAENNRKGIKLTRIYDGCPSDIDSREKIFKD